MRSNRKKYIAELGRVFAELRTEAKVNGLNKMSMREINEVVAEARREQDPFYGQRHKVTVTLSERMFRDLKAAVEADPSGSLSGTVRQAIGDYLRLAKPASKSREAIAKRNRHAKPHGTLMPNETPPRRNPTSA